MKDIAKKVFEIEIESLKNVASLLTDEFTIVVEAILSTKGKLVVTGIGKSGIIGKKIAATLSSTGTPSFFLHPGEAFHGDLGMVGAEDIVLIISYSGETEELLNKMFAAASNRRSTAHHGSLLASPDRARASC